jgi:phosphate transport system protein
MLRKNLQEEIQHAKDDLLILGSLVEQAMADSCRALKDHDFETSKHILERDEIINQKRFQIEGDVIAVIATQQPNTQYLRILTSILDMCNDLERMGDYAKGIATINLRSGGLSLPKILRDIEHMSNQAVDMLHRSLTAFIHTDVEAAQQIAIEDNVIDGLYKQIYFEVMDFVIDNPTDMQRANYVLWVAHNIERMADRVTNICERTIFVVTGDLKPIAEIVN